MNILKKIILWLTILFLFNSTVFWINKYDDWNWKVEKTNYSNLSDSMYDKVILFTNKIYNKYTIYIEDIRVEKINILLVKISEIEDKKELTTRQKEIIDLVWYGLSKKINISLQTSDECKEDTEWNINSENSNEVCTKVTINRKWNIPWKVVDSLYCFRWHLSMTRSNLWLYIRAWQSWNDMIAIEENWKWWSFKPSNISYESYDREDSNDIKNALTRYLKSYYNDLWSCEMIDEVKYEWGIQCSSSEHKIWKWSSAECKSNELTCRHINWTWVKTWDWNEYSKCNINICEESYSVIWNKCVKSYSWKISSYWNCSTSCWIGTKQINYECENNINNTVTTNCPESLPNKKTTSCWVFSSCSWEKATCIIAYRGLKINNSHRSAHEYLWDNIWIEECNYKCTQWMNKNWFMSLVQPIFKWDCLFNTFNNIIRTY